MKIAKEDILNINGSHNGEPAWNNSKHRRLTVLKCV